MIVEVRELDTARGRMEAAFVGARGPAVIVVHGMPGSYRQALPLARDLADRYRVVLPSRPGYGLTPLSTGRSIEDQADAYVALLDALAIDAAAVVGISGGGASAAAFALRHPQRCSSLALVCALVPHLFPVDIKTRLALAVPYLWELLGTIERRRMRRQLDSASREELDAELHKDLTVAERASLDDDPRMRERIVEFARSHVDAPPPWAGFRNDARNIIGAKRVVAPDHGAIAAETLVLGGDSDTVVPPLHAAYWAGVVRGARHETIAGGGHAFLLTRRCESMPLLVGHLQDSLPHDGAVDLRF